MATNKKPVLIRLSPMNYDKLKTIANRNARTVTNQVEYLVRSLIEDYERRNGQITLDNNDGGEISFNNQQIGNSVFVNGR